MDRVRSVIIGIPNHCACVCVCVCVCVVCVCIHVFVYVMCVCACICVSWKLPSNQSFYKQFAGYGKGMGHHKVGQ